MAKIQRQESLDGVEIGDVEFSGDKFEKCPNFRGAIFTGETRFLESQFLDGADFSWAKFSGEGEANFCQAQFSARSDELETVG